MSAPAEESIERGGTSKSQPGREEQAQDLCERRKKQNREAQRRFRDKKAREREAETQASALPRSHSSKDLEQPASSSQTNPSVWSSAAIPTQHPQPSLDGLASLPPYALMVGAHLQGDAPSSTAQAPFQNSFPHDKGGPQAFDCPSGQSSGCGKQAGDFSIDSLVSDVPVDASFDPSIFDPFNNTIDFTNDISLDVLSGSMPFDATHAATFDADVPVTTNVNNDIFSPRSLTQSAQASITPISGGDPGIPVSRRVTHSTSTGEYYNASDRRHIPTPPSSKASNKSRGGLTRQETWPATATGGSGMFDSTPPYSIPDRTSSQFQTPGEIGQLNFPSGSPTPTDTSDDEGRPILHISVEQGNEGVVRILTDNGVNINERDSTSNGITALHLAVRNRHEAILKLLLERGADVKAKDYSGVTPTHQAVVAGFETGLKLLLAHGADVNSRAKDLGKKRHSMRD